jgi:hypothetical protein
LSARRRPGQVRGRPRPRRRIRMVFISGGKATASCRWPAVMTRAMGRHRSSPPGESWCSARRGSGPRLPDRCQWRDLCHSTAPPVVASASQTISRAESVTRCGGAVRRASAACWWARITVESISYRPVRVGFALSILVAAAGATHRRCWSTFPRPTNGDAGYRMLVIDGLPVPVTTGQIPPRATGPSPSQHPVDHHTMIDLPPTPTQRAIR